MNPIARIRQALQWRRRAHRLERFAARLRSVRSANPFVVIVMPGSLHVARLALQKVPGHIDRLIVLNGLPAWEAKLAHELFHGQPVVACEALMEHDQVLDLLLDNLDGDFGILDYDCFVLDPVHFDHMRVLREGSLMNACFSRRHPQTGLRVPETFFLFFNRDAIQSLKARYGVTSRPVRWAQLPDACRDKLALHGLSADLLPEAHKDYFDTLRVLMMLGQAEGLELTFLADFPASPTPSGEIFHVGGISTPNLVDGLWRFRGAYFWRMVLERCALDELKERYLRIYGRQSAEDLKAAHPNWSSEVSEEFFDFCRRLVA